MRKSKSTETRPAMQGKELEQPFNGSHPDSRCPNRFSPISKIQLRHKFKTAQRKLVRSGVFATIMVCEHCQAYVRGIEDYTVLANVFSI